MLDYDPRRSLKLFKVFLLSPSDAFREMYAASDVIGALFVLDTLSFLSIVSVVFAGDLYFAFSFGFALKFLVLYVMTLVLFAMLVGFEAGVALVCANILGRRDVSYASLYSAFGYAKFTILIAVVVYTFLPGHLSLASFVHLDSPNVLMSAFLQRIEFFELIAFLLGVLGVRVVARLGYVQSVGVVLLGWLLGTPLFYCVKDSIL